MLSDPSNTKPQMLVPVAEFTPLYEVTKDRQIVWCRLQGYPHWPAQVLPLTKKQYSLPSIRYSLGRKCPEMNIPVMFFDTHDIAFVPPNAIKTFEYGIWNGFHTSKRGRMVRRIPFAVEEVRSYCQERNPMIPPNWWCLDEVLENSRLFKAMGRKEMPSYRREFFQASQKNIFWFEEDNEHAWPVQAIPYNTAVRLLPTLSDEPCSSEYPHQTVIFFGTSKIRMVEETKLTSFEAGVYRGYPHSYGRSNQPFMISIGEVWGYLRDEREWPPGTLSGKFWWNCTSRGSNPPAKGSPKFYHYLGDFKHINSSIWEPNTYSRVSTGHRSAISDICDCLHEPKERRCAGEWCKNQAMEIFCHDTNCSSSKDCQNRGFPKQKINSKVRPWWVVGQRGWVLLANVSIKKEEFIIEYSGERIDHLEYEKRVAVSVASGQEDFYYAEIDEKLYIDARHKGNMSRFVGSSCNPNSRLVKKGISPKQGLALVAGRDIAEGDHITINYRSAILGSVDCECGEENCRSLTEEERKLVSKFVGRKIEVEWSGEKANEETRHAKTKWWKATVLEYNIRLKKFLIRYDDGGDEEHLVLSPKGDSKGTKFRLPTFDPSHTEE